MVLRDETCAIAVGSTLLLPVGFGGFTSRPSSLIDAVSSDPDIIMPRENTVI